MLVSHSGCSVDHREDAVTGKTLSQGSVETSKEVVGLKGVDFEYPKKWSWM
jgi:hypothetical protein